MANHCENSLQVWGDDAATVAKFRTAVAGKSSDLELDNYPPLLVDESTDRELYEDWIMTWGMKYEAESTVIDENATYLHYYFNSWGSPPIIWLTRICREFPTLRFALHYQEPNLHYMGLATARDGKLQGDHCLKY